MLNQHFLLSPAALSLLFGLALFSHKKARPQDPALLFLVLVTFFFLAFNLLVNPELGMGRDWDLFAASGIGYTLLAVCLAEKSMRGPKMLERVGVVLAGTALVCALPWFLINSSEYRSEKRFRDLLVLDRERSAYGYECLSIFYRNKGMIDESIGALKEAVEVSPENPRYPVMLGMAYKEKGLYDLAITWISKGIRMKPSFTRAYVNLGSVYAKKGDYAKALGLLKRALELQPNLPEAHNNIADIHYRTGQYELAWKHLRKAESLGFKVNPRFYEALRRVSKEPVH
jgi:tetratricopeptide (TPR) repeat protein